MKTLAGEKQNAVEGRIDHVAAVPPSGDGAAASSARIFRRPRTLKVARLPSDVREELDARLKRRATVPGLCVWLNSLATVQEILAALFRGAPIAPRNVLDWIAVGGQPGLMPPPRQPEPVSAQHARRELLETIAAARFGLSAKSLFANAATTWGFDVRGDHRRGRAAILAAACVDFVAVQGRAPAAHLWRALSKKYSGLPMPIRPGPTAKIFSSAQSEIARACRAWIAASEKSPELFVTWGKGRFSTRL